MRLVTSAPSVSLSPKRISSIATVSFSLMIGITPSASSVRKRRARVQIAFPVRQVFVREQDLRGDEADARESTIRRPASRPICPTAAAACKLVHRVRAPLPAQPLHALGDRAARHEHDSRGLRARSSAICRAHRASAARSSPRPSLVTRLLPTFTTSRFASSACARLSRLPIRRRQRSSGAAYRIARLVDLSAIGMSRDAHRARRWSYVSERLAPFAGERRNR